MLTSKSTNILEENRSLEVLKVFLWSVPDNAIDFVFTTGGFSVVVKPKSTVAYHNIVKRCFCR
jgi:hypothetical protein